MLPVPGRSSIAWAFTPNDGTFQFEDSASGQLSRFYVWLRHAILLY
jgi:hypothetical protein